MTSYAVELVRELYGEHAKLLVSKGLTENESEDVLKTLGQKHGLIPSADQLVDFIICDFAEKLGKDSFSFYQEAETTTTATPEKDYHEYLTPEILKEFYECHCRDPIEGMGFATSFGDEDDDLAFLENCKSPRAFYHALLMAEDQDYFDSVFALMEKNGVKMPDLQHKDLMTCSKLYRLKTQKAMSTNPFEVPPSNNPFASPGTPVYAAIL